MTVIAAGLMQTEFWSQSLVQSLYLEQKIFEIRLSGTGAR